MPSLKTLLLISFLACAAPPAVAQLITWNGEQFMDTTSVRNPACAGARVLRYYSVEGKYPRSSETLTAQAQAFIGRGGRTYAGQGYLTFQFLIDCQGRRERTTLVLQTDGQYQPHEFAPALVRELYAFLQTLTEWKVGEAAGPVRYVAYLSFKIADGKVVAVSP